MLLLCVGRFAIATPDGGGDTVRAVVLYSNDFLLAEAESRDQAQIQSVLDSLSGLTPVPYEAIRELRFYQSVYRKSEKQINHLIDSLFELDTVPYALINEINLYVSTMPTHIEPIPANYQFVPVDESPYPAHAFYGIWDENRTHPYPSSLSAQDSTLVLLLRDTAQNCGFHPPLDSLPVVTSKFGWRDGRSHNGIDLDLEVWDPVKSVFAGKVRYAKYHEGYGRLVIVRHYNGLETYYAHLHRFKVEVGDEIESGQVVGLGGSSGRSTGSHLHFEVRFKGIPINPAQLIAFHTNALAGDTLVLKKTRHSYIAYQKGTIFHTVERGDYISKIARRYGMTSAALCALNGFSKNKRLRVGEKIRIEKKPTASASG